MYKQLKDSYPLSFGGAVLGFRFDNLALSKLEERKITPFNIIEKLNEKDNIEAVLYHSLRCYIEENNINADNLIKELVYTLSYQEIASAVIGALKLALVIDENNNQPKSETNEIDVSFIKSRFCDIMNRPESEFWQSTLKEIYVRWDMYALFMGYKKEETVIEEFDED